jgi:carbon storage regulator CsrA
MLVLSRRPQEVICIGNNIEVVVVQVRGDRVRIGIEASPCGTLFVTILSFPNRLSH